MEADLRFCVNISQFQDASQPMLKHSISYLNAAYRIEAIRTMPGGLMLEIEANDPNQGI
jgi:hypothetical protein